MTTTGYAPPLTGAGAPTAPSLLRLTLVEMRKTVDTRSGRWLLGVIGLGALAIVVLTVLAPGGSADRGFAALFEGTLLPVGLVLPVLGILTVTSEWSQRTALTTFTLVPQRERVLTAKLAAAVVYAVASVVPCLALAALTHVLGGAFGRGGSWHLTLGAVGAAALTQILSVVGGTAFGLLFLNSPAAIVLYFVLPGVWATVAALVPALKDVGPWLDLWTASPPLSASSTGAVMTGDQWAHLATSSLLWIALPLVVGWVRVLRSEPH